MDIDQYGGFKGRLARCRIGTVSCTLVVAIRRVELYVYDRSIHPVSYSHSFIRGKDVVGFCCTPKSSSIAPATYLQVQIELLDGMLKNI
jgi:hypothetical protein